MTFNFSLQAIDHVINSAAKTFYMSAGMVIKLIIFYFYKLLINSCAAIFSVTHLQLRQITNAKSFLFFLWFFELALNKIIYSKIVNYYILKFDLL